MNKHSLYYHNRQHECLRQHSILRDKQPLHHSTDNPPSSLVEETGHLTADKLNYINNWCLEVNKQVFSVEKKKTATKSTFKQRQQKQPSCSQDFSKSTVPKPVLAADTSTMTDKQNKTFKSSAKHTQLRTTTTVRAHRPHGGLTDKRRYKPLAKKTRTSNFKVGKLDLCVRNSTKEVVDEEGGTRVSHDFLTARRSRLTQKQNGNRSSAQLSSFVSRTVTGNDNLYGYYGFISAIVRNVAQCNDNWRRGASKFSDETPNPQGTSNSEDNYILLASRRDSFEAPRNESANLQKAKKTQLEEKEKAMSSFSDLQDGACTDDNEIILTSVSCVECTDSGNMEHVRNIDQIQRRLSLLENCQDKAPNQNQRGHSVRQNKQDNAPNHISDKENNSNGSTVLTENESIHTTAGVMENTIHYTSANAFSKHGEAQQSKCTSIESYSSCGDDEKNVRNEYNTSGCDVNKSLQNIVNENNNSRSNTKGNNTESVVNIANETKSDAKEDKKADLSDLCDEPIAPVSCCAASNCDQAREDSSSVTETSTIGHFCLSNNLLNMLTIDDCKISQRYRLVKTSEPRKEEMKSNSRIPHEVKAATNKAITRTTQDTKNMKSHLSYAIKVNLGNDRNKRTTSLENITLPFRKIKRFTNCEKGFHALMHDKTSIQETEEGKSMNGQKVSRQNEGPFYRRMHAALRKQIEELRPTNC